MLLEAIEVWNRLVGLLVQELLLYRSAQRRVWPTMVACHAWTNQLQILRESNYPDIVASKLAGSNGFSCAELRNLTLGRWGRFAIGSWTAAPAAVVDTFPTIRMNGWIQNDDGYRKPGH